MISLRNVARRIGWRRHANTGRAWLDLVPDRILGIETAAPVSQHELGFDSERIWYEASPLQLIYHSPTMEELVLEDGWREDRRVLVRQIGSDCDVVVFRKELSR